MPSRQPDQPEHRPGVPDELTDASRGIRLHKALADAGVASRRESEQMIHDGRVAVNGRRVTNLPAWVDPRHDRITVDGHPIRRRRRTDKPIYILLNKPRNVISTTSDPQGRRHVLDLIDLPDAPRLFPVGRLDADSTGLLILTNDGDLAQQLTHPSYEVPKQYVVTVRGRMTDQDMAILKRGLILTGRDQQLVKRAAMQQVRLVGHSRGKAGNERSRIAVTLTEGQNREIRRLLARLDFPVRRLERVAIGPIKLKGLGPGQWRMLTGREIDLLKKLSQREPPERRPPRRNQATDRRR